jgi:PGF-CTERM protein
MWNPNRRAIAAVLFALMLVVVPASAVATSPPARPDAVPHESTTTPAQIAVNNSTDADPADTVYVTEDGDAVLAYHEDSNASAQMELGMNMSKGLMHVLLTDDLESAMTGQASAAIDPTKFVANGSMTAPKPDSLQSLDLDFQSTQTSSESSSSFTLDAVVEPQEGMATQAGTVSTSGEMRSTASSLDFSGDVTVTGASSTIAAMGEMEHDVTITETETGYRVDVSQDYPVSYYSRQQWDTKQNATQTLQLQYGLVAQQLGGESEVTVDAYEFNQTSENTYQLDIEYAIEYRNVHEAVTQQLTQTLAEAENLTLSEAEARDVSERIQELEVERLHGDVSASGDEANAAWDLQLENFDTVALALVDVAGATTEETNAMQLDRIRKQLEASEEAGVVTEATWQGQLEQRDDGSMTVSFESQSQTENWAAYVEALEDRGINMTTSEFSLTATTTDGEVQAELAIAMEDERLLKRMFSSGTTGGDAPEGASSAMRAFRQADFERAKMDLSAENGKLRLEAGARFANASAFASVMEDAYDAKVQSIVSRPDGDTQITYVRVEGLVGQDATKSEVRSLAIADEDTTVKLSDEWDRQFPPMDVTTAAEYLGYDPSNFVSDGDGDSSGESGDSSSTTDATPTTTDDDGSGNDGSSGSMPGFGPAAALVALLAGVILLTRRRVE